MAESLPQDAQGNNEAEESPEPEAAVRTDMADLKVFWGPEICRLEYLLHLLNTGRIKDETIALTA